MTTNRRPQVLRTYTTQWLCCWATVVFWLLMHAPLPFGLWPSVPPAEQLLNRITGPLAVNLMLGTLLGIMLKLQFANPRARLLPGFAAAHLAVAAAIVGAAIVIETALAFSLGGLNAQLVFLSLSLTVIAATAWNGYLRSPIGALVLVLLFNVAVFARQYVVALVDILLGSPILSGTIACAALAALAALGLRLWLLSEEMPEYSRQMPIRWDFASRAGSRRLGKLEAQAISRSPTRGWLRDVQFRFVLRRNPSSGPLRRLLLRQLAGGFPCLSILIGLSLMMLFFLGFQSWSQPSNDVNSIIFLTYIPVQMILSVLGGFWLRSWPNLARESLRPLGRQDFIRDFARSMACDIAAAAAVHCAMLALWLNFLSPQDSTDGLLLPWLVLTILQYVAAYGVMFWVISFRNFGVLILGIVVVSGLSAGMVNVILFVNLGLSSPGYLALMVAVTVLTATMIYRQAFRRWCHLDLA